jgi:O-succinylbenzoate synthase
VKIAISRYELTPRRDHGGGGASPRSGALIRFEFEPNLVGYADCHPWPELGDISLNVQMEMLRTGATTPQLNRARAFARTDAIARSSGEFLFEGMEIPESHATFPYALSLNPSRAIAESRLDHLCALGFNAVKIKVGNSPLIEITEIARIFPALRSRGFHVRFDFNEKLSREDASGFVNSLIHELGSDTSWIDWLEDPCLFDIDDWERLRAEFGIPLALDRSFSKLDLDAQVPVDVLVLKPAVTSPDDAFELAGELNLPIAVTSYLDHPLGQVAAAWVAGKAMASRKPLMSGGLATHLVYESNPFSEELLVENGQLIPSLGTGFGFDELLEGTEWQPLSF